MLLGPPPPVPEAPSWSSLSKTLPIEPSVPALRIQNPLPPPLPPIFLLIQMLPESLLQDLPYLYSCSVGFCQAWGLAGILTRKADNKAKRGAMEIPLWQPDTQRLYDLGQLPPWVPRTPSPHQL